MGTQNQNYYWEEEIESKSTLTHFVLDESLGLGDSGNFIPLAQIGFNNGKLDGEVATTRVKPESFEHAEPRAESG